jgi:hypothetical protein
MVPSPRPELDAERTKVSKLREAIERYVDATLSGEEAADLFNNLRAVLSEIEDGDEMTVSKLAEFLSDKPIDMHIEVEVFDEDSKIRLWGPLLLATVEDGEIELFARHNGPSNHQSKVEKLRVAAKEAKAEIEGYMAVELIGDGYLENAQALLGRALRETENDDGTDR